MSKGNFEPKKYWEDRLSDSFNAKGVGFNGLTNSYNKWLYRVKKNRFIKIVNSYVPDEATRVLDVGCGTGEYIEAWKKTGRKKITGIDISKKSIESLSERFQESTFYEDNISELKASRYDRFDAISCIDVYFHITDDERFRRSIEKTYKLLKRDGILLFSSKFVSNNDVRMRHVVHRKTKKWKNILRKTGFEIIGREPISFLMGEPKATDSYLVDKLWKTILISASKGEFMGNVIGGILFPIEMILTSKSSSSPSTEIMICRKRTKK